MFRQGWKLDHDGDGYSWLICGTGKNTYISVSVRQILAQVNDVTMVEIGNFTLPEATVRHVAGKRQSTLPTR